MKAIEVRRTGGPEVREIAELTVPPPQAKQVVVNVAAAGVNFIAIHQRQGAYRAPLPFPLERGETALIHAAFGGVGRLLV
jgi:NADPH2:quinone reductase